ncbi:MAG: hypothetical protein ACREQ5_23220, partial [Candidatus Dormibacteria bacterium]
MATIAERTAVAGPVSVAIPEAAKEAIAAPAAVPAARPARVITVEHEVQAVRDCMPATPRPAAAVPVLDQPAPVPAALRRAASPALVEDAQARRVADADVLERAEARAHPVADDPEVLAHLLEDRPEAVPEIDGVIPALADAAIVVGDHRDDAGRPDAPPATAAISHMACPPAVELAPGALVAGVDGAEVPAELVSIPSKAGDPAPSLVAGEIPDPPLLPAREEPLRLDPHTAEKVDDGIDWELLEAQLAGRVPMPREERELVPAGGAACEEADAGVAGPYPAFPAHSETYPSHTAPVDNGVPRIDLTASEEPRQVEVLEPAPTAIEAPRYHPEVVDAKARVLGEAINQLPTDLSAEEREQRLADYAVIFEQDVATASVWRRFEEELAGRTPA